MLTFAKHFLVRIFKTEAAIAAGALLMTGQTFAFYQDAGFGARPAAMGHAFSAVEGDISSIFINPSALASMRYPEVSALYGKMYMGIDDDSDIGQSHFMAAVPLGDRYFGGVAGLAWQEVSLSGYYSESSFILSFSSEVRKNLLAGVNLKLLRVSYESDIYTVTDPLFSSGYSKSAFSADLGAIYRVSEKYSIGLSIRNLNSPNTALKGSDNVPRQVKAGAAYVSHKGVYDLDIAYYDSDYDVSFGADRKVNSKFSVRFGLLAGNDSRRNVNLGFGGRFGNFRLDYAFTMPLGGINSTSGLHKLSFSVRFGGESETPGESAYRADMDKLSEKLDKAVLMMNAAAERALVQEKRIKELENKIRSAGVPAKSREEIAPAVPAEMLLQIEALKKELEKSKAEIKRFRTRVSALKAAKKKKAAGKKKTGSVKKPVIERPDIYVVRKGDTLKTIARKIYGDSSKWVEIYKANASKLGRGGQVKEGQILTLPGR